MFRDPLQLDAARKLIVELEAYEAAFDAMVAGDMASDLYSKVNESLEQIRQATSINSRDLLFCAIQLVLAHSVLTSKLWQRQMARQHVSASQVTSAEIDSLRDDHRRAIKRLGDRCKSLLAKGPN